MNWNNIQEAIDYIENNICDNLNNDEIAKKIYSSSFHFQRAFSIITGISLGEYIRNRKLSLAGHELFITKAKVIDIALKYGYESPESFTKAFSRFHGINPSEARISNANLIFYNPLTININITGGFNMNNNSVMKEVMKYVYDEGKFSECPDLQNILEPIMNDDSYTALDYPDMELIFEGTNVAYTNSGRAIGEAKGDAGINALSPELIAIIEKSKKMIGIITIGHNESLNTIDTILTKLKGSLPPDTQKDCDMTISVILDETLNDEVRVTIVCADKAV